MNIEIANEIKNILNANQLKDLKKFIKNRENLNFCNSYLIYLFYIVQSAGILTTSIATSYDNKILLWSGISLNMLASLIQVFEKINDSKLKKLLKDIQSIKEGTFIDESSLIDTEKDFNNVTNNINENQKTNQNYYTFDDNNNKKKPLLDP